MIYLRTLPYFIFISNISMFPPYVTTLPVDNSFKPIIIGNFPKKLIYLDYSTTLSYFNNYYVKQF